MKPIAALAIVAAVTTLSGPAFSQDWAGFYAGVHAGYAFGDTDWTFTDFGTTADHDIEGPAGGLQAGYNFQSGNIVYGGEVDATLYTADGDTPCPGPSFNCGSELGIGGSARLRAGFATDGFLFYATGGAALVDSEFTIENPGTGFFESSSDLQVGWTVGGGIEYLWTPMISARLEYRYTDLGENTFTDSFDERIKTDQRYHTVFVGLNWHF